MPATRGTAGRRTPISWSALGLDNYRFSVEWSRVEPAEGEISRAALDHYRRQCAGLRERGVDPVVTFHHFTTPAWLTSQGGWESGAAVERFGRFCTVVAGALGDVMASACTVNEPNIVATMGWHAGMFPPGKRDVGLSRRVGANLADAHRLAVEAIRSAAPGVPVGLTLSMTDYQLAPGGERRLEAIRHHAEDVFLDATAGDDFLGVQVYTRMLVGPDGWAGYEEGVPVLDMGYEFYPASLGHCLRRAWQYTGGAVPLFVTENGIGTDDDTQRIDYVRQALSGLLDAVDEGVDVARLHLLVPARQLRMGVRLPAPIRPGGRRPHDVRPDAQTERGLARLGGGGQRARRGETSHGSQLRVGHDGVADGAPQRFGEVVAHARDRSSAVTRARRMPSPARR